MARRSIDATSLTMMDPGARGLVDGGLWLSDVGRLYLAAQQAAMERAVRIRRTFIIDRPEIRAWTDFIDVLRAHMTLGIEVRTPYPEEITGTARAALADFIIFDGVLSYHTRLRPAVVYGGRSTVVTTTLITDAALIHDRVEQYHVLWTAARSRHTVTLSQRAVVTTGPLERCNAARMSLG